MNIRALFMTIWGSDVRWRGLRIMTASFLFALAGAALAFASGEMRELTLESLFRWPFELVLIVAWVMVISGLGGMLGGILLNLFVVLGRMR